MSDPSVADWRQLLAQSTYDQLREAQAALAASQADLTRTEAELHDALRRAADLEQLREEVAHRRFSNESDQAEIQDLTRERDEARAEAREMRRQAEHWLTKARETARDLARSDYENRRLQAELDSALGRLNDTTHLKES